MTEIELQNIIDKLREYTATKRQSAFSRHAIFFLGVIDIVCSLTEHGLYEPRPIRNEEEHWFGGSYHMNFLAPILKQTFIAFSFRKCGKEISLGN